ncbi:MAG: hypothetical protein Q9187_007565, partial [Circinaria calcarea]
MDSYILPATTYQPPPRPVRKHVLNTIIEDEMSEHEEEPVRGRRARSQSPAPTQSNGSCSPVPSLTSSISSYCRNNRRSRDFDDLYDISDSESELDSNSLPTFKFRPASDCSTVFQRDSMSTNGSRSRYPSIVIPSPKDWPAVQKLRKNSSVPPTPPPKIPISPAVLSLLGQSLSLSTAPPSLNGSLTSDEITNSTAPPTPDTQSSADDGEQWGPIKVAESTIELELGDAAHHWEQTMIQLSQPIPNMDSISVSVRSESPVLDLADDSTPIEKGVQLPEGALDTLRHLCLQLVSETSSTIDGQVSEEMQEVSAGITRCESVNMTPASAVSSYSFSQMSVPSPGGFFSSLGANARQAWCGSGSPVLPSSAAAERFYTAPWHADSTMTIERTLETDDNNTEGPPTARQMPFTDSIPIFSPSSMSNPLTEADSDITIKEIQIKQEDKDFDEEYTSKIQQTAESSLDRTSTWLAAQNSYMKALRETVPINHLTIDSGLATRRASKHVREDSLDSPMKKAVKFLDTEHAKREGAKTASQPNADPLFYHAFQHISSVTSPTDSFVHQHVRYDSLQASRSSSPKEHVDQLLGFFHTNETDRPVPLRPISMMPGRESVEETTEQRVFARVEKERQALDQVASTMWVVEAARYLNGGRLLNSPASDLLNKAPSMKSELVENTRVLDLGGQPNCDWAWHCARDFPHAKIYTATSDHRAMNTNLHGPSNHSLVRVANLWQLPFPSNHFDVISARSLFTFLKNEKPLGETVDEYDMCLRECIRCLKPGGFLEFFLLDSEIVHSGPRGTAVSVEFGFNLRSRGYDPAPTKSFLGRLRRAGLVDIKRAWTFLPSGAMKPEAYVPPETPPPHVSMYEDRILEAVRGPLGSGADAAN